MNSNDPENRLEALEISLSAIIKRLDSIEKKLSIEPAPSPVLPTAPPVIYPPQWTPVRANLEAIARPEAQPPAAAKVPPPEADEIEYKFGINGLLRGGAIVIVFAFLFLAAMLIGRGVITPPVQFACEILLCLVFVAIGLRKREEKEEFGHLMVGLGSFGLYASFAGAHLYKHLFEGEMLVGLYFVLSLLNFGYAYWRASQSFLLLGLIGGLIASMMPLQKDQALLSIGLHFLVLIPCGLIVIRHKWPSMATTMWIVSNLALIPIVECRIDSIYHVAAAYLTALFSLHVYGKVCRSWTFDEAAVLQPVILICAAIYSLAIDDAARGSLHELILAACGAAIGWTFKENRRAMHSTLLGALIVAAVFTPMGFSREFALFAYGIEALALVGLALYFEVFSVWIVGLVTLAFSLVAYIFDPVSEIDSLVNLTRASESLFLVLSSLSVLMSIRFATREQNKYFSEPALFLGSSLLVAFFMRGLNLAIGTGGTGGLGQVDSASLGISIACFAVVAIAVRTKHLGLICLGAILTWITSFVAWGRTPEQLPQWLTVVILALASSSFVLGTIYVVQNSNKANAEAARLLSGFVISTFLVRAMQVAGTHHVAGLNSETIIYLAFAILNVFWIALSIRKRSASTIGLAWLASGFTAFSCLGRLDHALPVWLNQTMLCVSLISFAILYVITPRKESEELPLTSLIVLINWVLATVWLRQLLGLCTGLDYVAAITVSWVIFAVALIAIGFRFDRRYLRYWSLVIFGVTVVKVFMVDLAALDSMIRVLMLMLLGMMMVGGGYRYILWRKKTGVEVALDLPKSE